METENLNGKTFGLLTVLERALNVIHRNAFWEVRMLVWRDRVCLWHEPAHGLHHVMRLRPEGSQVDDHD